MCFGGSSRRAETPAPAPPPPAPVAEEQDVAAPRRAEDMSNWGTTSPSLRVDRSATSGGVGASGAGLKM